MSESTSVDVKLTRAGLTRRLTIPSAPTPSWSSLVALIQERFNLLDKDTIALGLSYKDDDGDSIVFSSDVELSEVWESFATNLGFEGAARFEIIELQTSSATVSTDELLKAVRSAVAEDASIAHQLRDIVRESLHAQGIHRSHSHSEHHSRESGRHGHTGPRGHHHHPGHFSGDAAKVGKLHRHFGHRQCGDRDRWGMDIRSPSMDLSDTQNVEKPHGEDEQVYEQDQEPHQRHKHDRNETCPHPPPPPPPPPHGSHPPPPPPPPHLPHCPPPPPFPGHPFSPFEFCGAHGHSSHPSDSFPGRSRPCPPLHPHGGFHWGFRGPHNRRWGFGTMEAGTSGEDAELNDALERTYL